MFTEIIQWMRTALLPILFVFLSERGFADVMNQTKLEIVYHMVTINNWKDIVLEQLEALDLSGLGRACDRITVTVGGPEIQTVYALFQNLEFSDKVRIVHVSPDLSKYEFPAMEMIQQIAEENPEAYILYMHIKGVLHQGKSTEQNCRYWRRYMEYFMIERWEDCLEALENVDVCGVDWTSSPSGFYFSGNFWWARASYIRTCRLNRDSRYSCEQFIGTGQPISKTFHQSGENVQLMKLYNRENSPLYFHGEPDGLFFQGVMNLYRFPYVEEYYR